MGTAFISTAPVWLFAFLCHNNPAATLRQSILQSADTKFGRQAPIDPYNAIFFCNRQYDVAKHRLRPYHRYKPDDLGLSDDDASEDNSSDQDFTVRDKGKATPALL